MLGFRYLKFQPGEYVLMHKNGRLVREGAGISFYCRVKTASVSMVPAGSMDVPFIFEETTSDFQTVSVQGELVFRIADPKKLAGLLSYAIDLKRGGGYVSEDPQKLRQRVVNTVRVLAKKILQRQPLQEAIRMGELLPRELLAQLRDSELMGLFGLEILDLSILAVLPNKETARALEAQAREQILKRADEAVYERRNASIEQERRVKENEFNTEVAVENKKRQVRETQLDAERAVQQKQNQLREERQRFETGLEEQKKELIELRGQNARAEADARAYELAAVMKPLEGVDPGVIQSLAGIGMEPGKLIALAFRGLAENAGRIGQLNITPDLLQELMQGADAK